MRLNVSLAIILLKINLAEFFRYFSNTRWLMPSDAMDFQEGTLVGGACHMWNLPDEILLSMLAFLPIEDLCNVVQVR